MRSYCYLLFVCALLTLSGCVETNTMLTNLNTAKELAPESDEIKVIKPHFEYMGLELTEGIRSGHYTIVKIAMSEDLLGEIFPGRMSWSSGWVVNPETGKEFRAQAIFAGLDKVLRPEMTLVIDGDDSTGLSQSSKVILLNTDFTSVFEVDESRKEHKIGEKSETFKEDPEYRLSLAIKYGVELGSLEKLENDVVAYAIEHWGYFQSEDDGPIVYSPLSKDQIGRIAMINPQYDYEDKFTATTHGMISADPYATVVTLVIDCFVAAGVESVGPSLDAKTNRDLYSPTMRFLTEMVRRKALNIHLKAVEEETTASQHSRKPKRQIKRRAILSDEAKEVVSTAKWVWDYPEKDAYRSKSNSYEDRLAHVQKALDLMGLDPDVQLQVIYAWRHDDGEYRLAKTNTVIPIVIAGDGRHDDVPVKWGHDMFAKIFTVHKKGQKVLVGEVLSTGHWILL